MNQRKGLVRQKTKEGFVPDVATFNFLAEVVFKPREGDFLVIFNMLCVGWDFVPISIPLRL